MKTRVGIFLCQFLLAGFVWGFAGGDGSEGNPWRITNRSELEAVNNDLTAHYILINDIDLGDTNYTDAVIAQTDNGVGPLFTGVFDGNYKTIHNLTITGGSSSGTLGLFGRIQDGGIVKALKLENCNISGDEAIGMIVGQAWNQVLISDCFASGTVSGDEHVGGLVGNFEDSSMMRSASEGNISGTGYVGGLAGWTWTDYDSTDPVREGLFADSYSSCSVNGGWCVGGLIGSSNNGVLTNCYASGFIIGSSHVNALIGDIEGDTLLKSCFWNTETSGQSAGALPSDGTAGISSAEMLLQSTFTSEGWLFSDAGNNFIGTWYMPIDGFPVLYSWYENMLQVPDMVHLGLSGVVSALEQAGFEIGSTNYVNSMTMTNGTVIEISVKEGKLYPTNCPPVDICVSLGICGDGSESSPYPIACEADLQTVNNDLSAHYYLARDISLQDEYTDSVIGSFSGSFNGNGHVISDLVIESGHGEVGLIRCLAQGCVYNLCVDNSSVRGDYICGILVGLNNGGIIRKCSVYGDISGGYSVGGLVGTSDQGKVFYSSFCGSVNGDNVVGGLVGSAYEGVIFKCFSSVCVTAEDPGVGGFVGYLNMSSVEECFSSGEVHGDYEAGGFAGSIAGAEVKDCYTVSDVYGGRDAAGFASDVRDGDIVRCYAAGLVSGSDAAGFIRQSTDSSVFSCFWDVEASGVPVSAAGIGVNTVSMQTISTYTDAGWNFDKSSSGRVNRWYMPEGDYPGLYWQNEYFLVCPELEGLTHLEMQSALVDAGFTLGSVIHTNSLTVSSGVIIGASAFSGCSYITNALPVNIYISVGVAGNGTESAPYPIACEADLQAVNNDLSAHYYLVRDISLQDEYTGSVIGSFSGLFDGKANSISDLVIESVGVENGLFERLYNGKIYGLSIDRSSVKGDDLCGILVGSNEGGIIRKCSVYGDVRGYRNVGGLVGFDDQGCIIYCSSYGTVIGNECVGGLVGGIYGDIIFKSFASARVKGTGRVGGLIGVLGTDSSVEQCFSSGEVYGEYETGGFVGRVEASDIKNSYTVSDVYGGWDTAGFSGVQAFANIVCCYAAGFMSGSDVGGFVQDSYNSSVTSCFWDADVSAVYESAAGTIASTVAMQDETIFISAGWDLTNVWYMDGYPKLHEFVESSKDEYKLWLFDSGVPALDCGQADAPAGDNIPNLLKYAIGLDPLVYCSTADLMLPDLKQSERKFTVTYQCSKDAEGVSLYPTWSASLISSDWRSDGFEFRKLSETTTTELWEASLSLDEDPSAFIRLNAELIEE